MALEFLLAIHEEEGLVLANGATDAPAELIQIEFSQVSGEETSCVERRVAQEFEKCAWKSLDPDLCDSTVGPARVRTRRSSYTSVPLNSWIESMERECQYLGSQLVVVTAVEQPVGTVARSRQRKRVRARAETSLLGRH